MYRFVADIGNSCLKICEFKKHLDGAFIRLYYKDKAEGELRKALNWLNKRGAKKIIFSSVNRTIEKMFIKILSENNISFLKVKKREDCGINIKYNISEIGIDRLANVVAARKIYKEKNIIVLDFGTAITVDIIESDTYLGGFIVPGLNTLFSALKNKADLLPKVSFKDCQVNIGFNTETAILFGTFLQLRGGMCEMLKFIRNYRKKRYTLVATGGDLEIVDKIPLKVIKNELLTFIGIREIALK